MENQGPLTIMTAFDEALTHATFPIGMLEDSLVDLETWDIRRKSVHVSDGEFISLSQDESAMILGSSMSSAEVEELKKQLANLQRIQKVTFSQMSSLRQENKYLLDREQARENRAKRRSQQNLGLVNGMQPDNAGPRRRNE